MQYAPSYDDEVPEMDPYDPEEIDNLFDWLEGGQGSDNGDNRPTYRSGRSR